MRQHLPKKVKTLRNEAGLTQSELGERVGRSISWVADLERGKTAPRDVDEAILLARVLAADPVDVLAAMLADQMEVDTIAPSVETAAEVWFDAKTPDSETTVGRASPRSRRDIEELAERMAKKLFPTACEQLEYIPVEELFRDESLNREFERELDDAVCWEQVALNDHVGGAADFAEGRFRIRIRNDFFQKAEAGDGRSRFTIAHEIGHVRLHGELLKRQQEAVFRDYTCTATEQLDPGMKIYESPEWQANVFAAAFLMPEAMLKRWVQNKKCAQADILAVRDLARDFRVSFEAARIRMERLFATM